MQYRFRISKNGDLYIAECVDFDNCVVSDTDLIKLRQKIKEKMSEHFHRSVQDSEIYPVYSSSMSYR